MPEQLNDPSLRARKTPLFDCEIQIWRREYVRVPRGLSVRAKAWGVVRRVPEVMVRINTRGPQGMGQNIYSFSHLVQAMSYISRHGKLEILDQDGNALMGTAALRSRLEWWQILSDMPQDTPEGKKRQEGTRIILSMPAGTDRAKFQSAVCAWTAENLEGYDFLMAFHDDTAAPHAHIVVRTQPQLAYEEVLGRFHVDKARIQLMRESLARLLNERGVPANATRRWARGVTTPRLSLPAWHVLRPQNKAGKPRRKWKNWEERSAEINVAVMTALREGKEPVPHPFLLKSQKTRMAAMSYAFALIKELEQTGRSDDRCLAQSLAQYYRRLPPVKSLTQHAIEVHRRHLDVTSMTKVR